MGGYNNNNIDLGQSISTNTNTSIDVESGLIDYSRKNKGLMKYAAVAALAYLAFRIFKKGR